MPFVQCGAEVGDDKICSLTGPRGDVVWFNQFFLVFCSCPPAPPQIYSPALNFKSQQQPVCSASTLRNQPMLQGRQCSELTLHVNPRQVHQNLGKPFFSHGPSSVFNPCSLKLCLPPTQVLKSHSRSIVDRKSKCLAVEIRKKKQKKQQSFCTTEAFGWDFQQDLGFDSFFFQCP